MGAVSACRLARVSQSVPPPGRRVAIGTVVPQPMCPLLSPHEGSLPAPLIPRRSAPQARCPLTAGGQGPVGPLGRTPISFTGLHPPGPSSSQPPLLVLSPWRLGLVKRGRRHCPWHCGLCLRSGLGTLGTLSLSQPPGFWAGLSVATARQWTWKPGRRLPPSLW